MNFTKKEEREVYEDPLKWFWVEADMAKKAENKGAERGIEKEKVSFNAP